MIGKLNFNPDELNDSQKYLIIISLVHDEFNKIKTDLNGKFVFDKFLFENLDLEKYKLSLKTENIIRRYINVYTKNYFADYNKYSYAISKRKLISERYDLEFKIKELEQKFSKINYGTTNHESELE